MSNEPDILELAEQLRDKHADRDPERRKRIERKRAQRQESAMQLRALIAPLAGREAMMAGDRGFLHVRADSKAAYLEFVPNIRFVVEVKLGGKTAEEQREKPGKHVTQRLTLHKDERGYVIAGFDLPAKEAAQLNDVKKYVATIASQILE